MQLTFALFKEADWWVFQCKEYDIASQAKTLEDIVFEVGRILSGHVLIANEQGRQLFENLQRCPDNVWQRCVEKSSVASFEASQRAKAMTGPVFPD